MANWPHSPVHQLEEPGAFMITAGTYQKVQHFGSPERLTLLRDTLLHLAEQYGWLLQAWAVMANHYHFVALSPADARNLGRMISHLHILTAIEVNRLDTTPGRKVWFQYWDTHLTHQNSYYARLNYVHQNAVHHGLVVLASAYPWCSAAWFERTASRSFYKVVTSLRTDRINVLDDFEVARVGESNRTDSSV